MAPTFGSAAVGDADGIADSLGEGAALTVSVTVTVALGVALGLSVSPEHAIRPLTKAVVAIEVVPALVELEVAVPRSMPSLR